MKPSHKALLSIGGVLAGVIVVTAVAGRVALSRTHFAVVDGARVAESADLTGFTQVEIAGGWQVNLTRGDEWKVELSRSGEWEKHVRMHVLGNRLRLGRGSPPWWHEDDAPRSVDIVMPGLEELDLRGGARITLAGFQGDRLSIDVAGAVQLEGSDGRYEELDLSVAGASAIDLRGIPVRNAEVDLNGASDVVLTMSGGILSGSVAGAGRVRYYGSVSEEQIAVAGITRVVHLGP